MHETCLAGALRVVGEMRKWRTGKKRGGLEAGFTVGKCKNFAGEWGGPKGHIS